MGGATQACRVLQSHISQDGSAPSQSGGAGFQSFPFRSGIQRLKGVALAQKGAERHQFGEISILGGFAQTRVQSRKRVPAGGEGHGDTQKYEA